MATEGEAEARLGTPVDRDTPLHPTPCDRQGTAGLGAAGSGPWKPRTQILSAIRRLWEITQVPVQPAGRL